MISLICYFYLLLWNVEVNKQSFAYCSTAELGIEIILIITMLPVIISLFKDK